jgi:hypothetical protein
MHIHTQTLNYHCVHMYTPALLTINSISFDFLNYPKWINAKVASFVFHNTFHYVMMMNMNIKARQPATIWAITHSIQQQLSVFLSCWPSSWYSPSRPFRNMAVSTALYSSSVKSVLDWLSGTRESFWPYSFWTSRLWYSAAMPIRILLHVFLGWILLCLAIKREIIGDF